MSGVTRLVFMGSPVFAVPALKALVDNGFEVVCVYTQPPRPAGRGGALTPTPVHTAAAALGLEIRHPERLRGEALAELLATPCDAICVVGYGLLLPKELVDSRICLNVHPSALPRWRGATPVQAAVMAGDLTTEVCIMQLDAGMDTGPVYVREKIDLLPHMTASDVNDVVWPLGARKLVHVLQHLHELTPIEQVGEATAAGKITPDVRRVDWAKPALEIVNKIRGLSRIPGAVCEILGEPVKLLQAEVGSGHGIAGEVVGVSVAGIDIACGEGVVRITELQRPGKKALPVADVVRGWPELKAGMVCGG